MMKYYTYDGTGFYTGESDVAVENSTLIKYPSKLGLFKFANGNWELLFGANDAGQLTGAVGELKKVRALDSTFWFLSTTTVLEEEPLSNLLFSSDNEFGLVEVYEIPDFGTCLYVSGTFMGMYSTYAWMQNDETNVMLENVSTIAVVGGGTLTDINYLLSAPSVTKIDVLEINQAVIDSMSFMRGELNTKVNIILTDAVDYLANTNNRYDLIVVDPESPTVQHSSQFIELPFLNLIKSKTNEGKFLLYRDAYLRHSITSTDFKARLNSVYATVTVPIDGIFLGTAPSVGVL